ncbi:hypothetical protein CC85DRAFT_305988 [Cutaneotrichosporon oleaginosum]|uniref:Uncharacterized protein n=1 Tax=Cutaneotrichosporon oleaginosum TaxID=879819 RepID=A0A0J0XBG7_9TREE|nr:uncharacterized protein CC85DRAFT_305988 [Cutaneotrichosporon oleaginosum]KLT38412.1 hypothetical protein CC85DRAFT_305988 [Cutaneotrichosporon oleaginosum]TXT06768.1 hypothetical protein COLE_06099 [Cutaneotrichosporon oleaginosum]
MVIKFTATSVVSLLRGAAAAARHSPKAGTLHRFRAALRRAIHTIHPTALLDSTPHLPGSGRAAARVAHLSHLAPKHPLGPVNGAFRTGTYRPGARAPRGAALPAHVGLGSARTFATAPAAGSIPSAAGNVPVVLRAFSQIFDDDKLAGPLPTARRYIPYRREHGSRASRPRARQLRRPSAASCASGRSIGEQLAAYFPFRPTEETALPTRPEDLVTRGMSATLALPLSASLDALLAPAPIPYADAQVGIGVFARLYDGAEPLHAAYAAAGARIIPLLARMEALGLLHPGAWPRVALALQCDLGRPDILRVTFHDRCAGDVLALLGDMLDDGRFALTDTYALSAAEEAAIAEHWDSVAPAPTVPAPSPADTVSLVMPTLDMTPTPLGNAYSYADEVEPAWPSPSGASTPSDASSPSVLDSWATSPALSRSLSLDYLDFASDSDGWSVSPSDADAEVEAAVGSVDVGEVEVSWVGPGLSLVDSW